MAPTDGREAWAQARWADLVRTLGALGEDPDDAEAHATAALVHVWPRWRAEQRDGDVDVAVFDALVRAWRRRATLDAVDDEELARTLVTTGRLAEHQAARVAGTAPPPGMPIAPVEPDQAPSPAPLDAVRAGVRRRRLTALATAATLVLVAALAWVATRPGDPDPPPPELANPLPVPWWSSGVLHLADPLVAAPGVETLAQAGRGDSYRVVYGDVRGRVVQVEPDGETLELGRRRRLTPVVGSPGGRVAWVQDSLDGASVVLWDAAARAGLGRLPLEGDTADAVPVGLVGDTVLLRAGPDALAWTPDQPVRPLPGARVLAPADGQQVAVSPDGTTALTWRLDDPGVRLVPLVDLPLSPGPRSIDVDGRVLTATFGPDGEVVVVRARKYQVYRGFNDGRTDNTLTAYADLLVCGTDGDCDVADDRITNGGVPGDSSTILLPR